jgi:HAD superfamily hydrolase (TIGR01509 family)
LTTCDSSPAAPEAAPQAANHTGPRSAERGGRPKACIFDLDGTLIDSEPNYMASDRAFFAPYGIVYDEDFNARMTGRGTMALFDEVSALWPGSPLNALPLAERIERRDRFYMDYAVPRTRAFPAMATLVRELSARGMPMVIASGSSPAVIEACLGVTGLAPCFEAVISASEVSRGKPEPDIFLLAASRLGLAPADCAVFEDSRNGLLAAKAAGMACIALPAPGSDLAAFASADHLFRDGPDAASLEELLKALGLISI